MRGLSPLWIESTPSITSSRSLDSWSVFFFKALANFQWDRLLATDIISPAYLEGCYQVGQVYPDLCSSIFLMCERGDR